jgi:hypothetical protein
MTVSEQLVELPLLLLRNTNSAVLLRFLFRLQRLQQ